MLAKTARLECVVSGVTISAVPIFWYQERPNQNIKVLAFILPNGTVTRASDIAPNKFEVDRVPETSTSIFIIHNVEKQDSATYYCASWDMHTGRNSKVFGPGTTLIVTDQNVDEDVFPKPTIFLPSLAETHLHNAGTYLCLLENFFPDVIKVYWKEKNGDKILESQQGDTMKTGDRYMKFSWLTVPEKSLQREHLCVVKHESYTGADHEILFPPIKTAITTTPCGKDEHDMLRLQLTSNSACYTYLLLLVKSVVYSAAAAFCVIRRTGVCCPGKSP
ncbi:TCR gamma alternate reading frame protein isoform X2 [Nycticebus coucang]|nr:TCR gamma alternate reading frame protein isoform X2 [Nycticebus coucang]